MRLRTLIAIALTMCALPAIAQPPKSEARAGAQIAPESLVAIADVRLEAALDPKTSPTSRDQLLDSARRGYQHALEKEPKHKGALLGLARAHARVGEREKALERYKKCLALHPEAGIAHEVAVAHGRWKDWPGAVAWCEYALKIDPENRSVKKDMGFFLARAGKWDEAFATLCQIVPEAEARINLAGLLDHMGRVEESKAQLRLALKSDPDCARARELLCALEPVPMAPAPREVPARVTKVYCVSELIAVDEEKESARLVKLVTSMVRPYSWRDTGGEGTAAYFSIGSALVVTNAPDVQREVADLLEALTRLRKRAAEKPLAHPLRNVAAGDAAGALVERFEREQLYARVTFDAPTNTVFVTGEAEALFFAGHILAALDKAPAQVVLTAMVMKVPDTFVENCGLNVGAAPGATSWVLTARERHMLNAFIREAKGRGECDVLSRPMLSVCDNQTGSVEVGHQIPVAAGAQTAYVQIGFTLRATPRVRPDGGTLLRAEVQVTEKSKMFMGKVTKPGSLVPVPQFVPLSSAHYSVPVPQFVPVFNARSADAAAELKPGETFVIRTGDTLVLITPTAVSK